MAARHPFSTGLYALVLTGLTLFRIATAAAVVVLPNNKVAVTASMDHIDIPLLVPRQDPNQNYFTNPPGVSPHLDYQDDRTYSQGSQLNITWETGLPSVDLILCQPALDGTYGQFRLAANISQRFFFWNVTYSDVTTVAGPVGNVFFFQVRPPSQLNPFYDSHYFNITDPAPGASPDSNGDSSSSGANTPPETGSPASSAPKTSNNNSSSPSSSSSNSTSSGQASSTSSAEPSSASTKLPPAVIGAVSVSFVLGLLIAAAFAWWLLVFRRRRRRRQRARSKVYITGTDSRVSSSLTSGEPQELTAVSPVLEIGSKPPAHEVETREAPVELPDTPAELP